jgi:hypothetical protein
MLAQKNIWQRMILCNILLGEITAILHIDFTLVGYFFPMLQSYNQNKVRNYLIQYVFSNLLGSCGYCDEELIKKKKGTRKLTNVMKKEFLTTRQTLSALSVEQCLLPTMIEGSTLKKKPMANSMILQLKKRRRGQ